MRTIDADALYRRVKTECNPYGKPSIGWEDGQRVMEWIKHAPTIGGWISVKDSLPENKGDYLIYNTDGTVWPYWYDPFTSQWFDSLGYRTESVTHWMPLPEPPKEETT